jgi:hypothetical protein
MVGTVPLDVRGVVAFALAGNMCVPVPVFAFWFSRKRTSVKLEVISPIASGPKGPDGSLVQSIPALWHLVLPYALKMEVGEYLKTN